MSSETRSKTPWIVAGSIVAVVVIVAVAGIVWFFSGDAPEEVSLEGAVEDVQTATTVPTDAGSDSSGSEDGNGSDSGESGETGDSGNTGDTDTAEGIEGTWVVDLSLIHI